MFHTLDNSRNFTFFSVSVKKRTQIFNQDCFTYERYSWSISCLCFYYISVVNKILQKLLSKNLAVSYTEGLSFNSRSGDLLLWSSVLLYSTVLPDKSCGVRAYLKLYLTTSFYIVSNSSPAFSQVSL
jgi:hypothetical protein